MKNSLKIGILALSLITVASHTEAATHSADKPAHTKHTDQKKTNHHNTLKKIRHIRHKNRHTQRSDNMNGIASWYGYESGPRYRRRPRTANGEFFNPNALTAAHPTLPFGTLVTVTNQSNHKTITVRINDRGPFVSGRVIDLSRAAAKAIGMKGIQRVSLSVEKFLNKYSTKPTTT